jgi:cGMP-dependent protein kinase
MNMKKIDNLWRISNHLVITTLILEFLTYDQRSAISSVLFTVQFKKGEIIVTQGEAATSFFIIKKGSVSVIQDEKEIRKMKKGESFGEMALF